MFHSETDSKIRKAPRVEALRNPGVNVIYAVCPQGAKERAFPHFNHNPMQNRALNLLLLTGQIAQKRLTQGSAKPPPWVALFLRASRVRALENAGAIHIDRTQIQMTISSAPSGLIAFNCDAIEDLFPGCSRLPAAKSWSSHFSARSRRLSVRQ